MKKKDEIFVGREGELNTLKNEFETMIEESEGRFIMITGKPGIGKTALIESFIDQYVDDADVITAKETCLIEGESDLQPFFDLFKEIDKKEEKEESSTALGFIGLEEGKNKKQSEEIFENTEQPVYELSWRLLELCEKKPMVIGIEDLDLADKKSILLLRHLADKIEEHPLFLIGSYRETELDKNPFLRRSIPTLIYKQPNNKKIELSSLTKEESSRLINELLSEKPPEDFIEMIHGYCAGNPLFIEEIVDQLSETGKINPSKNEYPDKIKEIEGTPLMEDIMEKRVSSLDSELKDILSKATVLGYKFSSDLLFDLTDIGEMEFLKRLDTLLDKEFIKESDEEDVYEFTHPALRDHLYSSESDLHEKFFQNRIAEVLSRKTDSEERDCYSSFLIGDNYKEAGKEEQALIHYLKGAEKATRDGRLKLAAAFYEKAISIAEDLEDGKVNKSTIIENGAETFSELGQKLKKKSPEEAQEYLQRANMLYNRLNELGK